MSETPQHPRTLTASPFARLAAAQAVSMVGDACLTVALAGSLFFTLSPGESRPRVLLYLVVTMAPFSVVAPVIGPMLDRSKGGRRTLLAVGFLGRAVLCFLMARHLKGFLLFPLAFGALVLSKGHTVAKSSIVPAVVEHDDELFQANSRLALISIVGAAVGGIPAALVLKFFGAQYALLLGAVVFLGGVPLALRIPKAKSVAPEETVTELEQLHTPSIVRAGSAMAVLRGGVGFLTFLLAFALKESKEPAWFFGLVLVVSGVGGFIGVIGGPHLRRHLREESILAGSLLVPAFLALFGARDVGRFAELITSFAVAAGAAAGRAGFDSLLQRDGPEEVRGRAFARFETRFQLIWVIGALLPVAIPMSVMSTRLGLFILSMALGFVGLWYLGGLRGKRLRETRPPKRNPPPSPALPNAGSPSAGSPGAGSPGVVTPTPGPSTNPPGGAAS
jgi:predicted MFS family arabinose efflux permease